MDISYQYDYISNPTQLMLDKSKIFNQVDVSKRKTKVICTLG
jgi:hypothetical protein